MTEIKTKVFEIIQDIPDDKLFTVIEVLKGLRALYVMSEINETKEIIHDNAFGIFSKYSNSDLVPIEKEAWGMAVKDKYAAH